MEAIEAVDEQARAYNARDLDGFLACYAADVVIDDGAGAVLMRGRDEMRAAYAALFDASPELHAEIVRRIALGEYVVDEERVTGFEGSGSLRAVAVYHVADGLIDRVTFLGE